MTATSEIIVSMKACGKTHLLISVTLTLEGMKTNVVFLLE